VLCVPLKMKLSRHVNQMQVQKMDLRDFCSAKNIVIIHNYCNRDCHSILKLLDKFIGVVQKCLIVAEAYALFSDRRREWRGG
jgi:hypothetical protein